MTLFVNKSLNAATVPNAVHVSQNGQLVNGTVNVTNNGQTIQFTPSTALQYGALVQVFLDTTATDTVGNTVTAYQGSFTVVSDPAATAPAVVNFSPQASSSGNPLNTIVHAMYSEPLDVTTVNATNVFLQSCNGTSGKLAAALGLDATGTIIQLMPSAALPANTYCYFYAQNLKGTNGLAAQNYSVYFYMGAVSQTTAPTVVAVSPVDQLGNVPTNANIRVQFSGPIDPTTVNGTTIQVSGGGQPVTPGSISFSSSNQIVQITAAERAAGLDGDDAGDLRGEGCGGQRGDGANHPLHDGGDAADVHHRGGEHQSRQWCEQCAGERGHQRCRRMPPSIRPRW